MRISCITFRANVRLICSTAAKINSDLFVSMFPFATLPFYPLCSLYSLTQEGGTTLKVIEE